MLLLALLQAKASDITADLEHALHGLALKGPRFHRALRQSLEKHGVSVDDVEGNPTIRHTFGDRRGLVIDTLGPGPGVEAHMSTLFIWPDAGRNRAQVLEEINFPSGSMTRGDVYWRGDELVIAGHVFDCTNSPSAAISCFRFVHGRWKQVQHLESDHEGTALFFTVGKKHDPARIRVLTRRCPEHLEQPHVGPFLTYESDWVLKEGAYVKGPTRLLETPLLAMDRLKALVGRGDRRGFDATVPKGLRPELWKQLKSHDEVSSGSLSGGDQTTRLKFRDEGMVIEFARRKGRWVPSRLFET